MQANQLRGGGGVEVQLHGFLNSALNYFYSCTVHFDDSIIFIYQLMHLYIYYQITKTLCSFDSSYMFRHTACHHQGAPLSWLKSLVKNIRS
jgi:hypothetical protein